jgi:3D (Asp-Asp-Asp) domain-containing protein/septal ring factor EnvC (AmiA/AmiB activator)
LKVINSTRGRRLVRSRVVPGHLTTRHVRSVALAVCIAVAVALPTSSIGSSSSSSLRDRAQQLTQESSVLASRSRAAVLTVYALDSRLARARAQLDSLRADAARVSRQRAEATHALQIARRTFAASRRHLAARLRTVYEQGDSDAIAIILGARTIDDALSGLETVNAAAATDKTVVAEARNSRTHFLSLRRELAAREERLRQLAADVASTANTLAAARAERVAYIQQVAAQRRLNASQIGSLESQALAIQARANQLVVQTAAAPAPAPSGPLPTPTVGATGHTLTVTATAYTLGGSTATGAPVGYGVVAVDPSIIPLGTRLTIPGYGEGVAADTGGAIQGATIDLWFPSASAAAAWGRRTVTITLH